MSTYYFAEKLGNAYELGLGERSLGKLWFEKEGKSASPLTQEDAERICLKIVDYLNKTSPVTDEMSEKYGDSDETVKKIRELNDMADSVSCDCDDDDCDCGDDSPVDKFMNLMMLRAMLGD